jgi:hypothetical protein
VILKDELLKGRDKQYPQEYTAEISTNLDRLLIQMNLVRAAYGLPMIVDSGWRPAAINSSTPGAATHSNHMKGLACDISDPDGKLRAWVLANLPLMQKLGLYFEDFRYTKGWVHFAIAPPASGKRISVPNANRPTDPNCWDGVYDHAFDQAA